MALVESITWDSEPKKKLLNVRYKPRSITLKVSIMGQFKWSLRQATKAYRRNEKAQRTHYYHHCGQQLGSSGCCIDEEIDLDSHVIGDWSLCPQSVVKIKSQMLTEIEFRPFKRQPVLLTTSASCNWGEGRNQDRHVILLVWSDSSSFAIWILNLILILAMRTTCQTHYKILNLISTIIFGKEYNEAPH